MIAGGFFTPDRRDDRDPSKLGAALLARRDAGSGFDRLIPRTLSELADAAPLDVRPHLYDDEPGDGPEETAA